MPYQTTGDPITFGSDDPKAGALSMSTSLSSYSETSTDPVRMFAHRDAFRTVAEAIASAMASLPFDLYEKDPKAGRVKIAAADDLVASVLAQPSSTVTPYRFVESLQLDFTLHDRWAFLPMKQDDGTLKAIRLPAKWVSFAVDGLREITDLVLTTPNGKKLVIPITEVVFDVGYDPDASGNTTSGYSISHTLEASSAELERGAYYRAKLLAGGPKVPMYIKRPKDAPAWDKNLGRSRFIEDFKAYSAEAAGGVPILEDGMELAAAPQLIADQVQYKDMRLAAQVEFAIAMHFPPELIGYRQGTNSNLEALREQLYVDVLGGRIMAFRQSLNAGYRRAGLLKPNRYIEENIGVRLASSPNKQATLLQTQVGAPIRTVNEARLMLNLPTVPYGDELIVPLNVTKGGLASPTDTGSKAIEGRPGMKALGTGTMPQYKAVEQTMEERFSADLSKAFDGQKKRVAAALGKGDVAGDLDQAFPRESEDADLASVIFPHALALAIAGADPVLEKWNPDRENFDEEVMEPWILKASQANAANINNGIFAALAVAVIAPSWKDALGDVYTQYAQTEAPVWSTTIGTSSSSFGAADAAKASSLTVKTWRHVGSGKDSRSAHQAMDGETALFEDTFSNGLRWPGDPVGGADENANCHCRVDYTRSSE